MKLAICFLVCNFIFCMGGALLADLTRLDACAGIFVMVGMLWGGAGLIRIGCVRAFANNERECL